MPRCETRNEYDSPWEDDEEAEPEAPQHSTVVAPDPTSSAALSSSSSSAMPSNVRLAEKFEELAEKKRAASRGVRSGDDNDRSIRAYEKQAKQLRSLDFELTDADQLEGLEGFGEKSKGRAKVRELLSTGDLQRLQFQRQDPSIAAKEHLCQIHGVAGATADEWYQRGIRTIEQAVATPGLLTASQQVGARHWRDLVERIPREEVGAIVDAVRGALHATLMRSGVSTEQVATVAECVGCGSYRRGSSDSGDVDILVARRDSKPDTHLMRNLLSQLEADGCEMEHLVHADDGGDDGAEWRSYNGVLRLPGFARFRRLDLKLFSVEQFPFATLHFTSGMQYNVALRTHALARGLRLSEKGLRCVVSKQRGSEPILGPPIPASSEEEIFAKLGLQFEKPEARKAQVTPLGGAGALRLT